MQQMAEQNKRLKLCVRWFQQGEENLLLEQERLRSALDSAEKKCTYTGISFSVNYNMIRML